MGARLALMAVVGGLLGATIGFLIGWLLLSVGFPLLGSAVTLVGAGAGAILGFMAVLSWSNRREEAREQQQLKK